MDNFDDAITKEYPAFVELSLDAIADAAHNPFAKIDRAPTVEYPTEVFARAVYAAQRLREAGK
ncbi:MAG: hypothetical protein E6Q97_02890 [Desulfurellales bacterium]|nr:MAG: hypothetical protein E6Q97_02890 [Desulfurellales bacterium]